MTGPCRHRKLAPLRIRAAATICATVPLADGLEIFTVQSPTVADRKAPRTDASWIGRVRALPFKPTNLKLVDIKRAVRATLEERAAKPAK